MSPWLGSGRVWIAARSARRRWAAPRHRRAAAVAPGREASRTCRCSCPRRRHRCLCQRIDRLDAGCPQSRTLHRRIRATIRRSRWASTCSSQVAHRPQATICRVAAIVSPGERRTRRPIGDAPVGDERRSRAPPHLEERKEIIHLMGAERAVRRGSGRPRRTGGCRGRSSWSTYAASCMRAVTRALRASLESCTRHRPSSSLRRKSANPTNSSGGESRLEHHERIGAQRRDRLVDRLRQRLGIDRRDLLDAVDTRIAQIVDVPGEHVLLVHVAELGGTLQSRVFGLFDSRDPPQLRVDRPTPRELALGGRLEVARAPDDALRLSVDPHDAPVLSDASTLSAASDNPAKREPSGESAVSATRCRPGSREVPLVLRGEVSRLDAAGDLGGRPGAPPGSRRSARR